MLRGHDDEVRGWHGHRTVGGWPPRRATGQSAYGTPITAAISRCCAATTTRFGEWHGRRTGSGWPLRPRDRTARIWDIHSGSEPAVLRGHEGEVRGVAWSPDGQRLATASGDRTARIWDIHSGSELAVLRGHDDWVWCVAWSPDRRWLATGSRDWTIRIWDTDNGSKLAVLRGHEGEVRGSGMVTGRSAAGHRVRRPDSPHMGHRIRHRDHRRRCSPQRSPKRVVVSGRQADRLRFAWTGPAGYGMRQSASRNSWPTPTAASPGN